VSGDPHDFKRVWHKKRKEHPWCGGNKHTESLLVDRFLHLNGMDLRTTVNATVELALAVAAVGRSHRAGRAGGPWARRGRWRVTLGGAPEGAAPKGRLIII
jgi:hypothetical protein